MYRELDAGIGKAVAERTVFRTKPDGIKENWGDVARRVAVGNAGLLWGLRDRKELDLDVGELSNHYEREYELLNKHISNGSLLMSGRHLQHGDANQKNRPKEVFVNCSTSSSSFVTFYLLMSGCGVGRSYDDDLVVVDWNHSPNLRVVIDDKHPDYDYKIHESVAEAKHKYRSNDVLWHVVEDSREGWAKAVELYEFSTFEKIHRDKILVLDFSKVRQKGAPIQGMQGRPASGPAPLMEALQKIATLKGAGMRPWMQNMYVDHYLSECVLVGGSRRSSRMSVKHWKEKDIFDFISIKRGGFLWTSNNSIGVDKEFWELVSVAVDKGNELSVHAHRVFEEATRAAYDDKTGEPGFINLDKLVKNNKGVESYKDGNYLGSLKYQVNEETVVMLAKIAKRAIKKTYNMIVNPCSEIALFVLGDFCTIADVVPYFAANDDEAEEAFRAATRALIRVNTMDSIFRRETERTNRIGVSMTGIHEWFFKRWGFGWKEIIDENKSKEAWLTLSRFSRAVKEEASQYSKFLGRNVPHTNTTVKPAGTTSKLYALCEGAHLPAMLEYLRWVQFRSDDPLVKEWAAKGYPTRDLEKYKGTTIVGFPTQPEICRIGMEDITIASEATPEEQYRYLQLLEKYWIVGVDENEDPLPDTGNQISYTLKFDPDKTSLAQFRDTILQYQPTIRCCSVMPQFKEGEESAYEYLPETCINKLEYDKLVNHIKELANGEVTVEGLDMEHLRCQSGVCPI